MLPKMNAYRRNFDETKYMTTGEPRRVLISFLRYGRPKKSTQITFLQHF